MRVRKRCLPPGWYPAGAEQTRRAIEGMRTEAPARTRTALAGVLPHAGWEFSGRIALEVLSHLCRGIDTIVIIGGHLGPADRIVCAFEEAYETPLGDLRADLALLEALRSRVRLDEDVHADNTVEVQLPFVRYLSPEAMVLGIRAPPSPDAVFLGTALAEAAARLGRRVVVAGSTDLTHYGSNYDFAPAGSGESAQRWVREVNDRRIVESLVDMDGDAALDRALRERSACSVGGALAAVGYARATGALKGELLQYATSFDVHPAESFVGYAGILYS